MCVCRAREPNTSSSSACFSPQQTSDNAEKVKEIERRAQSLSGVLASPASDDDHVEKGRRLELQRFVLVQIYTNLLNSLSGSSRELSRGSNRSLTNMHFFSSYATSIMPKS
jgi:hypothetical protein